MFAELLLNVGENIMKILITGAWKYTHNQLEKILSLGYDVVFLQNESDDIPCAYEEIGGVVCNNLFMHHNIEKFVSLKFIQLTSAGFDRVPMEYINKHGITVYNAKGVYSIPMAEYAINGVLQLYKKSEFFINNKKEHKWEKNRSLLELYQKTVLIIGCGSVGTECAKRFDAFGCHVIGADKILPSKACYEQVYCMDRLNEALAVSDVVVITLPLTQDTKNLIDENRLNSFKQGAILVNIARGAIVNTKALILALENRLAGAVLDVFESEPLEENSPLWDMENVIITPHNSFVGDNNSVRLFEVIYKNLSLEANV